MDLNFERAQVHKRRIVDVLRKKVKAGSVAIDALQISVLPSQHYGQHMDLKGVFVF